MERIETPDDRTGRPTAYDRTLNAVRPPAPPAPVETPADREGMVRTQRARAATMAAIRVQPIDPFVHSATERRSKRMITTRTRRDGSKVSFETPVPPPTSVVERAPALSFDERLRRQRSGQP